MPTALRFIDFSLFRSSAANVLRSALCGRKAFRSLTDSGRCGHCGRGRAAGAWHGSARHNVPPACRDSFLRRNAVDRELLRRALRVDIASPQ